MPVLDRDLLEKSGRTPVNWRGRSGRFYALAPVSVAEFRLVGEALFLVALGPMVLWVGTAEDLVTDAESRARFRLALDCADRAFRLDNAGDAVTRLTIIWDLEGGEPALSLNAA